MKYNRRVEEAARAQLEREIGALCDAASWEQAATRLIQGYGPELLGLLGALHPNEADSAEVFSRLCESLWTGLRRFERRSSFRTWAYATARNLSAKFHRDEGVRRRRQAPLDGVSRIEIQVRDATLSILRSRVRTRLEELRDGLPEEDRLLLILRYDKELDWSELAQVMNEDDLDAESLKRESARLRKRFQLVKERLRAQAEKEGLLPSQK